MTLKAVFPQRLLYHLSCCCLLVIASGGYAKPVAIEVTNAEDNGDLGALDDLPPSLFWPDVLEWNLKPLFTEEDRRTLAKKMRTLSVVSLEQGCGRMKNRLATLEDGTRVCCRYRENGNQLRGDVYAYHFNRLLGMWNAPPTVAVKVDFSESNTQWRTVRDTAIEAGWTSGASIVVSQYLEELKDEHFPSVLKNVSSVLPLTASSVVNLSMAEKSRVMEWTDMIVFDFVIGHTDRLFNALINSKWNSQMMEKPVHNLKKTASSSDLVLIDNESGFDFGYVAAKQKEEYYKLQISFLESICVFRTPTIRALGSIIGTEGTPPSALLEKYIRQVDPLSYSALRIWRDSSQKEFSKRVAETLNRVHECASYRVGR